MNPELAALGQRQHRLCWLLVAMTVIGGIFHPPGRDVGWVGLFVFVPFLVALQWRLLHQRRGEGGAEAPSLLRRLGFALSSCYLIAVISVIFGMDWLATSVHLFGHQPQLLAMLIAGLAYGLEIGLILFLGYALPLFFIRRTNGWELGVRLLWMLLVDAWYPRLIGWSFGGITFFEVPWIEQGADLVGAWGLGFFAVGANLLLARWLAVRLPVWLRIDASDRGTTPALPPSFQWQATLYGCLFVAVLLYGAHFEYIRSQEPKTSGATSHLRLVSVQPNFSIFPHAIDKNAFPGEPFNLNKLFALSRQGLAALPPSGDGDEDETPALVVWPESAFPWPLLNSAENRARLSAFARQERTALLLAVSEQQIQDDRPQPKALSLLFDATGTLVGRYEKITLMPFGEYIPLIGNLYWLGDWVRATFPMISEFVPGHRHEVFSLGANRAKIAGAICFDAASPSVFRGMAGAGAQLIANLANLAWFGDSEATTQMEMLMRWRAIENRVPVLLSALAGETQLIDATGEHQGARIPLFQQGVLAEHVTLQTYDSFYRRYQPQIHALVVLLFLLTVTLGARYGRLFVFADTIGRK